MKQRLVGIATLVCMLFMANNAQAQLLDNILGKATDAINSLTGNDKNLDLVGTWNYTGSAVDFESENLLMQAGGTVAAAGVESKLDEQLKKVGIKPGKVTFVFNEDKSFTSNVNGHKISGTWAYDASNKQLNMQYLLFNIGATVSGSNNKINMLFNSDKVLKLISFLSGFSNSGTVKTIGSIAGSYDGMKTGFALKKK